MDTLSLISPKLSRRDFLKIASASLAVLGLSRALTPQMVKALEESAGKVGVIWLEGQDCAGCTESFLNSLEPSAASILLDTISLRYHETAMAASGHQAEEALAKTIQEGGYLLVIEGSIPMAEDGLYCTVGGKPFKDIVRETASRAVAIVPVGSCASFGGIPGAGPTDAVGYLFRGTQKHHYFDDVTAGKPVINLPTCPLHPERLVAVIVHYLTFGTIPPLDKFNRPLAFYGFLQHDNCERRGHFDAGRFLTNWDDPAQHDWCLYLKGCRGPYAYQDCWKRLWNNRTSYCIQANAPCVGCSEPEFYETFSPLYERRSDVELPGIGRVDIDKVMATVAGVAAAGLGAYAIADRLSERKSGSGSTAKQKADKEES
ncbi:MAG: hydrogenase small subunit [Dehalococcoidia bacterium]|nr:hydrogenase small subunit [Dehalococcoidia bacterium]